LNEPEIAEVFTLDGGNSSKLSIGDEDPSDEAQFFISMVCPRAPAPFVLKQHFACLRGAVFVGLSCVFATVGACV
jgi:hypothetical protein